MVIVRGKKDISSRDLNLNESLADNCASVGMNRSNDIVSCNLDSLDYRSVRIRDIVGREDIKRRIEIALNSARKRNDVLEHVLFYGPPGLGKTTFGNAIANELGGNIIFASGSSLSSRVDLISIFSRINRGDVVFIDEIHSLNKVLEENLYPVMENFYFDTNIGSGGVAAKIKRINIPKFTLIGATTQVGKLSKPLRDRFGVVLKLDFFSVEELTDLVEYYADKLGIKIDKDSCREIASRSMGTARIAIHNLKKIRDFTLMMDCSGDVNREMVILAFEKLGIDEFGLDAELKRYLIALFGEFGGGPVGVSNLAIYMGEDSKTIEEFYEPYLIKLGFVKRTARGRVLTDKGKNHVEKMLGL